MQTPVWQKKMAPGPGWCSATGRVIGTGVNNGSGFRAGVCRMGAYAPHRQLRCKIHPARERTSPQKRAEEGQRCQQRPNVALWLASKARTRPGAITPSTFFATGINVHMWTAVCHEAVGVLWCVAVEDSTDRFPDPPQRAPLNPIPLGRTWDAVCAPCKDLAPKKEGPGSHGAVPRTGEGGQKGCTPPSAMSSGRCHAPLPVSHAMRRNLPRGARCPHPQYPGYPE